jgi:hypothetical protein
MVATVHRFLRLLLSSVPVVGKMRFMKLTVIGGSAVLGLIGSKVVQKLTAAGHQAVPAALSTGVELITGKGPDQALEGAEVVVNLANSPTFDEASLDFSHLHEQRAGTGRQVILLIVSDQVPQPDYYRAKILQEDLLRQGPTPYSTMRVPPSSSNSSTRCCPGSPTTPPFACPRPAFSPSPPTQPSKSPLVT